MRGALEHLPVLAIAGYSGAGKTTLIEAVLPKLVAQDLRVAVIKHDVHGLQVDRPGKDSARLFEAGADVYLQGPQEHLVRGHAAPDSSMLAAINRIAMHYDLLLVEGFKSSPLNKIWLLGEGEIEAPSDTTIEHVLGRDMDRPAWLLAHIDAWLPQQWRRTPLYGALLIGGKSQRMGQPKHLLAHGGFTWLEQGLSQLEAVAQRVVIVGAGELPPSLESLRLPDVLEMAGPLAGILAAQRWAPKAGWLVRACDMPQVTHSSLEWLLAQREPGVWGVVPRLGSEGVEPLLAYYDPRARGLFEAIVAEGGRAPRLIAGHDKVVTPRPPAELVTAWTNINCPLELAALTTPTTITAN